MITATTTADAENAFAAPRAGVAGARPLRKLVWVSWLFGAGVLAGVVVAAWKLSDPREFILLAQQARPGWLAAALLLQVATYVVQGGIWRSVTRAAGFPLSIGSACRLSLTKLFVDQAIPSAGFSGTVVVARRLEQRGIPRSVVMASVTVYAASLFAAYGLGLAAAVVVALAQHHANRLILAASIAFLAFAALLVFLQLETSGHERVPSGKRSARLRAVARIFEPLRQADARLVRSRPLLFQATLRQLAIIALDAATLWVLVRALGATASAPAVFASFMIASLLRTLGFVPGGLGTFEAASVATLNWAGVPVALALSATLLFRCLSFWLPMLPGLIFWRTSLMDAPIGATPTAATKTPNGIEPYWSLETGALCQRLGTTTRGLSSAEVARRLLQYGPNELRQRRTLGQLRVLLNQMRSPLLLLLVFAAGASLATRDWFDAVIVFLIVAASVAIGFFREYQAQTAAATLGGIL